MKQSALIPKGKQSSRLESYRLPPDKGGGTSSSNNNNNNSTTQDDALPDGTAHWRLPYSEFRERWEIVLFVVTLFLMFETPIIIGFHKQLSRSLVFTVLSYFLDVFFIINFYLRLTKFCYINESGLVTNKDKIIVNYISNSRFIMDFVGSLPAQIAHDVIYWSVVPNIVATTLKFFRGVNFYYSFEYLRSYLQNNQIPFNSAVISTTKVFLSMLILLNLFGCMLLQLGCPSYPCVLETGWLSNKGLNDASFGQQLLYSYYLVAQTIFTVGYGDITPQTTMEIAFICLIMLIGVFLYALMIAIMTSVIANRDAIGMEFHGNMERINTIMATNKIPADMQDRIQEYFEFMYRRHGGKLESDLLNLCPEGVLKQIHYTFREAVENIPLLTRKCFQTTTLFDIIGAIEPRTYPPKSHVIRMDTLCSDMFILRNGRVDISREDNIAVSNVLSGEYFGDIEMLFKTKHEFNYVSSSYCDFFVLSRESFLAPLIERGNSNIINQIESIHAMCENYRSEHVNSVPPPSEIPIASCDEVIRKVVEEGDKTYSVAIIKSCEMYLKRLEKYRTQYKIFKQNLGKNDRKNKLFGEDSSPFRRSGATTISTGSKFRLVWDSLMFLFINYFLVVTPIRIQIAYSNNETKEFQLTLILDYVIDIFFLVDMVLNYRYFEVEQLGDEHSHITIRDKEGIRDYYLKSLKFKLDCVTCFPYDLVAAIVNSYFPIFRLARMLKVFHVNLYLELISDHLEARNIHVSSTLTLLVQLVISVTVVTTTTSCVWSMLLRDNPDHSSSILAGIYWSLTTMTTIGFGDITAFNSPTLFYSIVVIILGTTMAAAIIANIATIAHNVVISVDNVNHRKTAVDHYLKTQNVPHKLSTYCKRQLDYRDKITDGVNEDRMLEEGMPFSIRQIILDHTKITALMSTKFVETKHEDYTLSAGFLYSVASLLRLEYVSHGEMIVDTGENLQGMYILREGDLLLCNTSHIALTLTDEGSFGERALYHDTSGIRCTAVKNSSVYVLTKERYRDIEADFSREVNVLESTATVLHLQRWKNESLSPLIVTARKSKRYGRLYKGLTTLINGYAKRASGDEGSVFSSSHFGISFEPDGAVQHLWNSWMLLILLLNATAIPMGIAFETTGTTLWVFLAIGDGLLVLDIFFRAYYFQIVIADKLIRKQENIVKNYMYGRFSLKPKVIRFIFHGEMFRDLFAVIPGDVVCLLLGASLGLAGTRTLFLMRLPKLLHFFRLSTYWICFSSFLQNNFSISGNLMKVLKLMGMLLCACHWFGCLWFVIGKHGGRDSSWISSAGMDVEQDSTSKLYIASLYWACFTLTTVGYGDIYPSNTLEVLYATIVLIIGTCIYTVIIVNLEEIVASLDVTSALYQQKVESINRFVDRYGLSHDIQEKIKLYLQNLWENSRGVPQAEVLDMLPERSNRSIRRHFCWNIIENNSVLNQLHKPLLERIVLAMVPEHYLAGDLLFEMSACSTELFFLIEGKCELRTPAGAVLSSCIAGDIICEGDFFSRVLRICDCKAITPCNVFMLIFSKFDDIMNDFPEEKKEFESQIEQQKHRFSTKNQFKSLVSNLNNAKLNQMMSLNTVNDKEKFVYLPDSFFYRVWDTIMCFITVYNTFFLPFRWAFIFSENFDTAVGLFLLILDFLMDIPQYLNMYFSYNLFARYDGETLVKDQKKIRKLYLSNDLFIDIVTTFPVDLFAYILGARNLEVLALYRIGRMLDLLKFGKRIQSSISLLQENNIHLSIGVLNSIKMFSLVFVLSHWLACGFSMISRVEEESWMLAMDIGDASLNTKYLYSLYWAVYTVTTVGFGDVKPQGNYERIFSIIAMVLGAVLCDAGLTAVLTALIDSRDAKKAEASSSVECMKSYVKYRKFPIEIKNSIRNYLLYSTLNRDSGLEVEVLDSLSYSMRNEVINDICFTAMSNSVAFRGLEPGLIKSIVRCMTPGVFVPQEYVFRPGEVVRKMHFLIRGYVEVLRSSTFSTEEPYVASSNEVIGVFDDIIERPYRAATNCEVFSLHIKDYVRCLKYASPITGLHQELKRTKKKVDILENALSTQRSRFYSVSISSLSVLDLQRSYMTLHDRNVGRCNAFFAANGIILVVSWTQSLVFMMRLGQQALVASGFVDLPVMYYVLDDLCYVLLLVALGVHHFYCKSILSKYSFAWRLFAAFPYEILAQAMGFSGAALTMAVFPVTLHLAMTRTYLKSIGQLYLILKANDDGLKGLSGSDRSKRLTSGSSRRCSSLSHISEHSGMFSSSLRGAVSSPSRLYIKYMSRDDMKTLTAVERKQSVQQRMRLASEVEISKVVSQTFEVDDDDSDDDSGNIMMLKNVRKSSTTSFGGGLFSNRGAKSKVNPVNDSSRTSSSSSRRRSSTGVGDLQELSYHSEEEEDNS